ncbi:MAG: SDR family oxidoreductase [Candidatus Nomurabacteria bacterium]|jgi:NAD(P)-dependent dehydrogenase (short-subunit alcohol dehydrogenase family)|nr:SDR family oxidoreductase [Candidatus Nomurabacteria bacterium]
MNEVVDIKGKVVVVTGAAAGMGKAIALKYAAGGANVVANDLNAEALQALLDEAKSLDGKVVPVAGDTSDELVIGQMLEEAKKLGKLDVLICNAGIMDNFAPVEDVTDDIWQRVMNVNLNAPFRQIRAAMPLLEENKDGGSIIITASVGGLRGGPAGATYVASKHGVIGLMKAVAYASADKGVRCNAIAPGAVATDIGKNMAEAYGKNMHEAGMAKSMKGMGLNPRNGSPDEIANIALFLGSDASSLINGATIVADAGWSTY